METQPTLTLTDVIILDFSALNAKVASIQAKLAASGSTLDPAVSGALSDLGGLANGMNDFYTLLVDVHTQPSLPSTPPPSL